MYGNVSGGRLRNEDTTKLALSNLIISICQCHSGKQIGRYIVGILYENSTVEDSTKTYGGYNRMD